MIISGYYYVMRLLTDPPIFIVDYLSLLFSLYLSFDCVIIIEILQLATRMVTVGKIKEFNPQTVIFNIRGLSSALFRSEWSERGQGSSYVLDGHWPNKLLDHK